MALYFVRHAKAGQRSAWEDDDRFRPLSDEGRAQALAIAEFLVPLTPAALLTSPYVRCRQTLEPLAQRTGLSIRDEERIAEDSPLEMSLAALGDAPDGAVLCSHGDVIPRAIEGLIRRGMVLEPLVRGVKKGAMFELHRVDGDFVRAAYVEAPSL